MTTEAEKELPELHQAEIDNVTLEALFRDLAVCTQILAVIPKAAVGYAAPTSISLNEGRTLFISGQLRGLQIRYHYQGDEWWDTILKINNHVRITRIRQTFQNEK